MMFYTYILYSDTIQRHYIGQTNNIEARINKHNSGLVKSTKRGKPWRLIHSEKFESRKDAINKESKIKKRGAKRYLNDLREN